MHTVHQPPVSDEPPGPRVTPYFDRARALRRAVEQAEARLGLPPDRFAA